MIGEGDIFQVKDDVRVKACLAHMYLILFVDHEKEQMAYIDSTGFVDVVNSQSLQRWSDWLSIGYELLE